MIRESDLVPFTVSPPKGSKVLILSPHPDDETLGCGGTRRLLLQRKTPVKVIFLTSGDKADPSHKLSQLVQHKNPPTPSFLKRGKAGLHNISPDQNHVTHYSLLREKEAVKALRVLGISDYEFFRFPDRELDAYYRDALERLLNVVETYMPDTIYSPSVIELNPDHRVTAALSLEIQRIMMEREECMPIKLVLYEVSTPLRPNTLVDVTKVYDRKIRAIKKHKSQLKIRDYLKYTTALNSFRALTINGSKLVEAFWYIEEPLNEKDITHWLGYRESLNKI